MSYVFDYSDTNIGRTEIATIVDLARGCLQTELELGTMLRFRDIENGNRESVSGENATSL